MHLYSIVLKLSAPVFLMVGALHLALGLGAEALLGATVPPQAMADPGLDSQNIFYGQDLRLRAKTSMLGR